MAKLTLKELAEIYPNIARNQWKRHKNGGGWVQKTTIVEASAFVDERAVISGNARVYGNAWVINPLCIIGTRWPVQIVAANMLAIGCEVHPIEWWQKHHAEVNAKYDASDVPKANHFT